jgi:hypothetical protein
MQSGILHIMGQEFPKKVVLQNSLKDHNPLAQKLAQVDPSVQSDKSARTASRE